MPLLIVNELKKNRDSLFGTKDKPTGGTGFDLSDQEYDQKYLPLVDLKKAPKILGDPKFLASLQNEETYPAAIANIRKNQGWKVIPSDDPVTHTDRIMVFVPGQNPETDTDYIYQIQRDPRMSKEELPELKALANYSLSAVIAVKKETAPQNLKLVFSDGTHPSVNCSQCHGSSLIPPSKHTQNFTAQDEEDFKAIEKKFASYGMTDYAGSNFKKDSKTGLQEMGPAIGPKTSPYRNESFLVSCAKNSNAAQREQIRTAMNCAFCHDGREVQVRGSGKKTEFRKGTPDEYHDSDTPWRRANLSEREKAFEVGAYEKSPVFLTSRTIAEHLVKHRDMPPGTGSWPQSQKEDLWNCLEKEQELSFQKQLMKDDCVLNLRSKVDDAINAIKMGPGVCPK